MSGDVMPKEQHDFIKGIQDYMLEATNMEKDEAWSFSFRIWQTRNWLRKYMAIEVSEDCISRDWVLNRLAKYQKDYTSNELDDWQNTVVDWITTDIENAPSVVPTDKCNICCQYKIGFEDGKLEMIRMVEDALKKRGGE